jgi:ABC-type transporter MlaC component
VPAKTLDRRICLFGLTCVLLAAPVVTPSASAASARASTRIHPAVRYLQKAASELLKAQQRGTTKSFSSVLARRADVAAIADYSLGRYRSALPRSKRPLYYRGVRTFMARYFADQSRKYRIVKTAIDKTPRKDGKDLMVNSKIWLASGSTYTVVWRLAKRRKSWRITDVKVLGFSLAFLQRGIFYKYLRKKNGDVNALVAALNR